MSVDVSTLKPIIDTQCYPQLAGYHIKATNSAGGPIVIYDSNGDSVGNEVFFDEEGYAHKTSVDGDILQSISVQTHPATIKVYDYDDNTLIRTFKVL